MYIIIYALCPPCFWNPFVMIYLWNVCLIVKLRLHHCPYWKETQIPNNHIPCWETNKTINDQTGGPSRCPKPSSLLIFSARPKKRINHCSWQMVYTLRLHFLRKLPTGHKPFFPWTLPTQPQPTANHKLCWENKQKPLTARSADAAGVSNLLHYWFSLRDQKREQPAHGRWFIPPGHEIRAELLLAGTVFQPSINKACPLKKA